MEDERSVLVAKKTGNHKFMVLIDGVREPKVFKILVQEGMVVPIKFTFTDIHHFTTDGGYSRTTTTTFDVQMTFEKPIPFVSKK